MSTQVEYNPVLALRNISEFEKGQKKEAECIPKKLEEGKIYLFFKKGQRNFWLYNEVPLVETSGSEIVSSPKASILILEETHFLENNEIYTKGRYKVLEVLGEGVDSPKGFERIGIKK